MTNTITTTNAQTAIETARKCNAFAIVYDGQTKEFEIVTKEQLQVIEDAIDMYACEAWAYTVVYYAHNNFKGLGV